MLTDQIAVLNSAYASARFRFTLSNVYKHTNKNWCATNCCARWKQNSGWNRCLVTELF